MIQVSQVFRQIGPVAAAGALALTAALAFHLSVNSRLQTERDRLRQQPTPVAAAVTAGSAPQPTLNPSAPARLARFYAGLPDARRSADVLGRVLALAAKQGLDLQSGEYRLERQPDDRIQRYRITLPVQGSYAQVRRFVDAALLELPALALDDIEFHRVSADATVLDAQLRFTLHLRGDE